MKKTITLAIVVFIFASTINVVESDIIAGDEFELVFPITNDNSYIATYEFYLIVYPDAEGFNITITPDGLVLNPGETKSVIVNVSTPLQTAGGNYTFILHYNYSGQENGGGEPSGGSGSSSSYYWTPPDQAYIPSEDDDIPDIPDDFPDEIHVPGPDRAVFGNLGILFLFLIILIIAIMLFVLYKKKRSE